MQKQSSSWLGLLLPAILATVGGALVVGEFGSSSSINPIDFLMRLERFYREDLAYRYASLEVSDKRLEDAAWEVYNFLVKKQTMLINLQEDVERYDEIEAEDMVATLNTHIKEVVYYTYLFFKTEHSILVSLESNERLSSMLEKMGLFYNVGKIIYTSMDQIRIGDYAKLVKDTLAALDNWLYSENKISTITTRLNDILELLTLSESMGTILKSLEELYGNVIELDDTCSYYLKKRCTWMLHTFVEEGKRDIMDVDLSLVLFFNDVAALIHRYAEYVEQFIRQVRKIKIGHALISGYIVIMYHEGSNPMLLDAVKAWANTVALLEKHKWPYLDIDLEELGTSVYNDRAWIRVGSAPGHAAHIGKEGETFTIMYYDDDFPVNSLFAELVNKYVPGAKVKVLDNGVRVKVGNKEDLLKVAKLLTFTTSLAPLLKEYSYQTVKHKIEDTIEKLHILG